MTLKERVDRELRRKKRSRSWLAGELGMTADGLRLSLIKESIKYGDIVRVCEILGVRGLKVLILHHLSVDERHLSPLRREGDGAENEKML